MKQRLGVGEQEQGEGRKQGETFRYPSVTLPASLEFSEHEGPAACLLAQLSSAQIPGKPVSRGKSEPEDGPRVERVLKEL